MSALVRASDPRTLPASLTPVLLTWFRTHRRALPWRRNRDPYRIWVAEVLLQQTRVAQAAPYFDRFVRAFPTVTALAQASEAEVLKIVEGAGYYARARHLREAAIELTTQYGGSLPSTVAELQTLPGVGEYIARAIASLAFDVPTVALEANGVRVATRWTRDEGDPRSSTVRRRLERAIAAVLPRSAPGAFNEAMMELGETVCRPRAPLCRVCPVSFACRAYRELPDPSVLPHRRARSPRPHVRAAVIVLDGGGRWLVQRRPSSGLLGGLFEFPGGKIEPGETPREAAQRELVEETGIVAPPLSARGVVRHAYSHFTVELHVFSGSLPRPPRRRLRSDRRWVTPAGLARLPVPKATEKVVRRLMLGSLGRASPGSGSRPDRTPLSPPSEGGRRPARSRARRTEL